MPHRILSWNCRRAGTGGAVWQYITELAPDIAVLQEVTGIPQHVRDRYDIRLATPENRGGRPQRFQSAMLARGTIGDTVQLQSGLDWVNDELKRFAPNLLAHQVVIDDLPPLTVVAVYSPAWPVSRERLHGKDLSTVKLSQNLDVWVADLLVSALKAQPLGSFSRWIIAGDFNSCESFDVWKGGPRGNREWLDRMAALDLVECLRHSQGMLTPTFRRPGAVSPKAQIDHIFVSHILSNRLLSCRTGDFDRVYSQKMSDHLPIIADFSSFDPRAI